MSNSKTAIVRNVEFHHAHVFKAHDPFGDFVWDVQLRTTDENTAKQLMDLGVKMKRPDGEDYFAANVKRPVKSRKGEDMRPVAVVDGNKNPIDPTTMIGHGSKGHVKLFSYNWEMRGKSGTSAMLVAMQITDLIEYEGGNNVDFDVEDASDF